MSKEVFYGGYYLCCPCLIVCSEKSGPVGDNEFLTFEIFKVLLLCGYGHGIV